MADDVLVTMNDVAVITRDDVEKKKEKIFRQNPRIQQAMQRMDPRELDRNILEGLINQRLIDEYIVSHKINQSSQYQMKLKDLYDDQREFLNSRYFIERNSVTVSEDEIKNFYEENKDKHFRISYDDDQKAVEYVAYEIIKDKIREEIEQQKRHELFIKDVENLKKEYAIEIKQAI